MVEAAANVLLEPLADPLVRRGLLAVAALALVGGALGPWLIRFNLPYAAESVAHGMLPGLVLAALGGVPLILGGVVGLLAATIAIALVSRVRGLDPEIAVAASVTTLVGAGALLALSAEAPPGLGEILFGDVLAVSGLDLALALALAGLTLAGLFAIHHRLLAVGFDREAAASLGVRARAVELALLALLAAALLVAVQVLGNLLAVAALIAPAAVAIRLAGRVRTTIAAGAIVGVLAGAGGLYASFHLQTAAGASIAACSVLAYAAVAAAARTGLTARLGLRGAGLR